MCFPHSEDHQGMHFAWWSLDMGDVAGYEIWMGRLRDSKGHVMKHCPNLPRGYEAMNT